MYIYAFLNYFYIKYPRKSKIFLNKLIEMKTINILEILIIKKCVLRI